MTQLDYRTQDVAPTDFTYGAPEDSAGLPARVAIYADSASMRREIEEDLGGAGFRTVDGGDLARLLDGPIALLGDVVMVDCPKVDGRTLAALARLDMRVAQAGAKLIVSTSLDALDAVFASLDQCDPQILVLPGRGERIVAVGRMLADMGNARVREMSEEDRLNLLHLSRQVEAIASQLDRLSDHRLTRGEGEPSRLGDVKREFRGPQDALLSNRHPASECAHTPMPDPRLVRRVIAARQARARFFDRELFADPAWDMLLDLTAATAERSRVSVTSLCIAAEVPATTALRWIRQLVECGLFERVADPSDRRRAFIGLSESSKEAMARYFTEVEMPLLKAA